MEVYAVWNVSRNCWVGSHYYVTDKPKIYLVKGAAQNKADRFSSYYREVCEVKTFELVEKE